MGLIFVTMLGAILGWLSSIIRRVENSRAFSRNIIAGVIGAWLGGISSNPLLGKEISWLGSVSVDALLISLIGALALLLSVNLLHRSEMR